MDRVVLSVVMVVVLGFPAFAQDPKERDYLVPALSPKHADKPKVTGWADKRIEEKLDRSLTVVRLSDGKAYLSWRLLKSDPAGAVFNLYRGIDGGSQERLNAEPISATTDFVDAKIPAEISGADIVYQIRLVVEGKEIQPVDEAVLKGGTGAT
ncbi:MAG: hypothetical protein GX455_17575, partial [Phycisphaerae bacterium]|nr:hypothetical protein [Phycisphaerae bacterium]